MNLIWHSNLKKPRDEQIEPRITRMGTDTDKKKSAITGLEGALLLNFKEAKLQWKRVVSGETE